MSSDAALPSDPRDALRGAATLLVTGCYRSGTTLLEKLLHVHPQATVASQPFPLLYVHAKQAFDDAIGIQRRYPLDHLFLEDGYSAEQLHAFLDRHVLDEAALTRLFDELAAYTAGLWTPEMLRFRGALRPGTFHDVFAQLLGCVAQLFPKPGARVVGAKEVLYEEYVPYLLGKGTRAIIIVRDPRAMILSLNFGRRDNKTGLPRPVLYSLRAWRKSVAIALACEGRDGFAWMRYEDLIADTGASLACVARFLGLAPYPPRSLAGVIRDQWGEPWGGNSSFDDKAGVSASSVDAFRDRLPPAVLAYIETACLPEMRALGYAPVAVSRFDERALADYRDPFDRVHPKFPADYSSDPARIRAEVERHARLTGAPLAAADARRWFLHERAYQRLRGDAAAGPER
jgi:hypothetical protein